jgi:heme exporter protein CcmB
MNVIRTAWLIARKDLIVEARSRELAYTTLFFSVACVLVFAFAFIQDGRSLDMARTDSAAGAVMPISVSDAAAGILWVAVAFSGTLALGRAFERERQGETLRALLLAPSERAGIYLGKLAGMLLLMVGVEIVLVPVVGLLFGAPIARAPFLLGGLLVAGTVGFAGVGTLFAAMLIRAHSRDVLLPVLLYPITVPVIIAGVRGTAAIFGAEPNLEAAAAWLSMLVFFDAVFVTLALWTFGPVMTE